MSKQNLTKFEFLLTLDGDIVCQRFFNVLGHNPVTRKSLDLHDYVKDVCEEITESLKNRSSDYLYENREYYYNLEVPEKFEKNPKSYFLLELKMGNHVFIQRMIDANLFHPKARYVDIRPNLGRYLSDLTNILSSEEVETKYLNYSL